LGVIGLKKIGVVVVGLIYCEEFMMAVS
jgi:hypothetical protein